MTISDNTGKIYSLAGFVLLIGFELTKWWSSIAFHSANNEISLTYFWMNEKGTFVKYLFKGTSHDSIFQFSLFSSLADIFAV